MKYVEVLNLIKRAAEGQPNYGGYSYNGRLLDLDDGFQGDYGHPQKGSYGYALDQRSRTTRPGDFFVGSHSLPSGWAGRVGNITESQLRANRRQVAASNAKKLVPDNPQLQQWAAQNFRVGGRRNAKAWQSKKTLAPETTHQQWIKDPNYQKLQPQQQNQFRRVFNSMAYKQPLNTGTTVIG